MQEGVMGEGKENTRMYKVALLVSMACVLQISESLIPHPIPGLRLGLANMLTLVALVTLGFRYALQIPDVCNSNRNNIRNIEFL